MYSELSSVQFLCLESFPPPCTHVCMCLLAGMLRSARDSVLPEVCTAVTKLHK